MGKILPLNNHLNDPAFRDPPPPLVLPGDQTRLSHPHFSFTGGWEAVAKYVSNDREGIVWFPDSNVAILPKAAAVWDQLRLAALGSASGSTVITGAVEAELGEWLAQPRRNERLASALKESLANKGWARSFRTVTGSPEHFAVWDYAFLLGQRRVLTWAAPDGKTLVGTDPADKARTMDEVIKRSGPRAVRLAKKGREEIEKRGKVRINDELHCMMAVLSALTRGRHSFVLTADEDFAEIFYKAQWFLDTHYRAWLVAKLIRDGQYGEPSGELVATDGFFDGPLTLYDRRSPHLMEVLPPSPRLVWFGVLYVDPLGLVHEYRMRLETEMLGMLRTRGETRGKSTDLFGEKNLHVDLGPLCRKIDRLCLGVGKDRVAHSTAGDYTASISAMDRVHSLHGNERFSSHY